MPPRRKAARAATRTRAMRGARTRARRESLSGRNHPRARRMSSPSIPRTLRTGRPRPPTRRTTRVSGPNRRQRYRRRRRARNGLTVSHRYRTRSPRTVHARVRRRDARRAPIPHSRRRSPRVRRHSRRRAHAHRRPLSLDVIFPRCPMFIERRDRAAAAPTQNATCPIHPIVPFAPVEFGARASTPPRATLGARRSMRGRR